MNRPKQGKAENEFYIEDRFTKALLMAQGAERRANPHLQGTFKRIKSASVAFIFLSEREFFALTLCLMIIDF